MLRLIIHHASEPSALETGAAAPDPIRLHEARTPQATHPWDVAHEIFENRQTALESADSVRMVEPDVVQRFDYRADLNVPANALESFGGSEACSRRGPDPEWAFGTFGWHLSDTYTQLKSARDQLGDPGDGKRIRVGILDTGYDPHHQTLPLFVNTELAANFTGSGAFNDATDPDSSWPGTNPGHGTATMALFAGRKIRAQSGFDDFLGGAPWVDLVPIRIADSVIQFRTSSMASGIRYAVDKGCRVISISMGGVPTQVWADAVNYAYERGVCICAAAGNRIGVSPPANLVYPARFRRVIGVCGFTHTKTPYRKTGIFHKEMHGSFGPESAMPFAMAAYTPNIPWAAMGCESLVNEDGAGTSSATPQCAAAAALWLQKHGPAPHEPWKIVEGIRRALFSTGDKSSPLGSYYHGQGLLRARDALNVNFDESPLTRTAADEVSFPWLRTAGALEAATGQELMLETEALQLFLKSPAAQERAAGADPQLDQPDNATQKEVLKVMADLPFVSTRLRAHLKSTLRGM